MKFYEIDYRQANSIIANSDYEIIKEKTLIHSLNVALQGAVLISKCDDIIGAVDVVDGTTGEIIATYDKGLAIYLSDAVYTK